MNQALLKNTGEFVLAIYRYEKLPINCWNYGVCEHRMKMTNKLLELLCVNTEWKWPIMNITVMKIVYSGPIQSHWNSKFNSPGPWANHNILMQMTHLLRAVYFGLKSSNMIYLSATWMWTFDTKMKISTKTLTAYTPPCLQTQYQEAQPFRGHFHLMMSQNLPVIWNWCVNGHCLCEQHIFFLPVKSFW